VNRSLAVCPTPSMSDAKKDEEKEDDELCVKIHALMNTLDSSSDDETGAPEPSGEDADHKMANSLNVLRLHRKISRLNVSNKFLRMETTSHRQDNLLLREENTVLRAYFDVVPKQSSLDYLLARIGTNPEDGFSAIEADWQDIYVIIKAMGKYPDDVKVQKYGCQTLNFLMTSHLKQTFNNRQEIGKQGGSDAVIKAMGKHPDDVEMQVHGCETLSNLCLRATDLTLQSEVIKQGGIDAVIKAMCKHRDHMGFMTDCRGVVYMGCEALTRITGPLYGKDRFGRGSALSTQRAEKLASMELATKRAKEIFTQQGIDVILIALRNDPYGMTWQFQSTVVLVLQIFAQNPEIKQEIIKKGGEKYLK